MPALIPAVGYARRSSKAQDEASIPEQKRACEDFAREQGYLLVRWYSDDAVSGDNTDKRVEFLRMIKDAQTRGDFRAIVCWDHARFGRFDSLEQGFFGYQLRQANVHLVTVKDGALDWTKSVDRIIGSVKQEGKHEQLLDHSRNVVRGQLGAMQNGGWVGCPPYAYRLEGTRKNRRLVLGDPGHRLIVQRIYKEFADDGRSMNAIATRLNHDAVPTARGRVGKWRYDEIKVILTNPAYAGDFTAGRWEHGKYYTIKGRAVAKAERPGKKPESEWIIHRDHHEPIVSREIWERTQGIFANQKAAGRRVGHSPYSPEENPYLLSGLLRCGRCSCPMHGLRQSKYRHYKCSLNHDSRGKECSGTQVREDRVLLQVADFVDREFLALGGEQLAFRAELKELKPEDLPEGFARLKSLLSPPEQPAIDRKQIVGRVRELSVQIEKARKQLVLIDPEFIPDAQATIRELEQERDRLENALRKTGGGESDLNEQTFQALQALYWVSYLFRCVAQEHGREQPEDWTELLEEMRELNGGRPVAVLTGAARSPLLRRYLRHIAGITLHTRTEGSGKRRRHQLQGGEITLHPDVGATKELNRHFRGQRPAADR
ncbi:Recombinase [Urbifossiella limnaea]|uniref:Recombinase n=2 Tax=Urbifossiella limnaea TaxID=2528023 RepID=A0A517Y0K8_9BACT|nr:Recombinase [Urbifossiella limnaea]